MPKISVAQLYEDNREKLRLRWVAEAHAAAAIERGAGGDAAFVGHLNLLHPNRIQVLGPLEFERLAALEERAFARALADLFAAQPAAIVFSDDVAADPRIVQAAQAAGTALLASPLPGAQVIERLRTYLAKRLADSVERHGVLMDVLGLGVLITGDAGVGKSELALELISRGHGLVADDVVEVSRIAPNALEGRCPPLLKNFIEVRGLGLLDIRTIFGETAVRPKMNLKLIVHLERTAHGGASEAERLPLAEQSEEILGVTVKKVVIPVAPGRNLAVLLEAAVRNTILQLRGIDSAAEFAARQRAAMKKDDRSA